MKRLFLLALVIAVTLVPLLYLQGSMGAQPPPESGATPANHIYLPIVIKNALRLLIVLRQNNIEHGISLDYGGDVDTLVVSAGIPPTQARRTGNGQVLPSPDSNQDADWYMQFRVDDSAIFAGAPTTRLRIEVEYFDQGTDAFGIEYDAVSGGPYGTGEFKPMFDVVKTNTGKWRTAVFALCDAYFANRTNGGDFRISDHGDGAEIIRRVTVIPQPSGPAVINVDACGANPWDSAPDSDAIQACVDAACPGDTVTFTSGVASPGYQGYMIDKTIFLVATTAKSDLTFTSTSPANHALLKATASLKGFVVRLWARSRVPNGGDVDDITISHLNLDGNRSARICYGPDGVDDGIGDNWGSWLPECSAGGDPWCSPGGLGMDGEMDWADSTQNYHSNPWFWSTGLMVDDLRISNTECATALGMGAAASTIRNTTIDTAGDHVHAPGCAPTENDEGLGDWSDGITFSGPDHTITGNTIINPSDVGIVFFGGKNTVISNNTVQVTSGNYGAFAGIAIHPWALGDVSGLQVTDNQVTSLGSTTCGGLHAGINIGTHMWNSGCVWGAHSSAVGNPNSCSAEPAPPLGALCIEGALCQEWAHVAAGTTFTFTNNYVAGAHINYLIEGLDLMGTLVESGNTSGAPRMSDWEAAKNGCSYGGYTDFWGAIDRVAHHPSLAGWTDKRIHCER
jgi:parallel beta-helix repeat protein